MQAANPVPGGTETGSRSVARPHLGYIDGLRALLAFYVVCVHSLPRAWAGMQPTGLIALLAKCLSGGHLAVTAFIVVSGYCLAIPALRTGYRLREGTLRFYLRRYLRIAPPLFGAFLVSTLCLALTRGPVPPFLYSANVPLWTLKRVVAHLFLMQFIVPDGSMPNNGPFWSITVEFVIYLWFPLLLLLWRKIGPTPATLLAIVGGYVAFFARGVISIGGVHVLERLTTEYYGAFALGALAARIAFSTQPGCVGWRARVPWIGLALALFVGVAGVCWRAGWPAVYAHLIEKLDLAVALAVGALLIGAHVTNRNVARSVLQVPLLERVGIFSFSLYLLHYPLFDVFQVATDSLHLPLAGRLLLYLLVGMPLVIAAAWAFYRAVELPAHRLSRRVRTSAAAVDVP